MAVFAGPWFSLRRSKAMSKVAFGIDLSGYVTNGTACAQAKAEGDLVRVSILDVSPFSGPVKGKANLGPRVQRESSALKAMLERGNVAVDVPIDLQGLHDPQDARQVRDLTMRPIDVVLRALPPLAERIGAPVARFAYLANAANVGTLLGERLFETYPGGTRRVLMWNNIGPISRDGFNRASLIEQQNWLPNDLTLTDDEIDASICAIAALNIGRESLGGEDLLRRLDAAFSHHGISRKLPKGFILLVKPPRGVTIDRVPFSSVIPLP